MKTTIESVLHLYLGSECKIGDSNVIQTICMVSEFSVCTGSNEKNVQKWFKKTACKPILRPISDIKESELNILSEILCVLQPEHFINAWQNKTTYCISIHQMVDLINELRKMGFDMDNLIESGQAIDATTIEK